MAVTPRRGTLPRRFGAPQSRCLPHCLFSGFPLFPPLILLRLKLGAIVAASYQLQSTVNVHYSKVSGGIVQFTMFEAHPLQPTASALFEDRPAFPALAHLSVVAHLILLSGPEIGHKTQVVQRLILRSGQLEQCPQPVALSHEVGLCQASLVSLKRLYTRP